MSSEEFYCIFILERILRRIHKQNTVSIIDGWKWYTKIRPYYIKFIEYSGLFHYNDTLWNWHLDLLLKDMKLYYTSNHKTTLETPTNSVLGLWNLCVIEVYYASQVHFSSFFSWNAKCTFGRVSNFEHLVNLM